MDVYGRIRGEQYYIESTYIVYIKGGHSHRLYSHNCDCSWSAVSGQSRSKGCNQRSKRAQNHTVYGQSVLRSTENCCETANLGGVMREVKCQRPKISAIISQTAEKSRLRF